VLLGTIGRRAYLGALLALMVVTAGGVFCNGLFFTAQPYQLNYGEGLVAWQAAHITDSARAYAPIDRYPFVVFQYPPLFHLATRAMGAVVGTIKGDLLMAGRLVSLVSAALLCLIIGWVTFQALPRRTSRQMRLLAAAFAAALPTTLYNFNWTWLARVDTLAILLSFSGLVLFAMRPRSAPVQILASVLMVAAIFTRQTALAAPLACVLVAVLIHRRSALRMLLTMSILGGAVLTWFAWWTHGQALLHLFRYNQNPFSIARAVLGVLMNTRDVAGLLVLAGGASLAILSRSWDLARRRRWDLLRANLRANGYRRTVFLLAVYGMLAGLSGLAFGKEGADINYFLEWNLALAPLAGILLFRAAPQAASLVHLQPAWLAVLAIPPLLFNAAFDQARTGWQHMFGTVSATDRQSAEVFERTLAEVRGTPGPVFSEDMNLLYKSGKDIPADPAMIQCLAATSSWDQRPFVRMIQERRFALVVAYDLSSRERYSPAVAGAIERAYDQTATIGDYLIYRPRSGVPDASPGVR
jgi:hypothetical protein